MIHYYMLGDLPLLVWAYMNQHVHMKTCRLPRDVYTMYRTRTVVATMGEKTPHQVQLMHVRIYVRN